MKSVLDYNTKMWCKFVKWFRNHETISDKAWELYENSHASRNTARMSCIEYNAFLHNLKQEILKVL